MAALGNNSNTLSEKDFEALFREHFSSLSSFAYKYLHDWDIAKERVHEVFINLWEKRDKVDPNRSLKSYLFSSVYNRCMNYLRDEKKFDRNVLPSDLEESSNTRSSDKIENKELEKAIKQRLRGKRPISLTLQIKER